MKCDYLIVGSGLTGATIARKLHDAGKNVLVVERRSHIGGNVFDCVHSSGIRYCPHGVHYFRTNSDLVWSFVNRFSTFYKYEAVVNSFVDGKFEAWPIQKKYIGGDWKPDFTGTPQNFEEACLSTMPFHVYEKFVKGYTEKQWGVPCTELSPFLAGRFDVRDGDIRLKKERYQGLPTNGYSHLMENMLFGIPIILNFDYLCQRSEIEVRDRTFFTGPIDEYYSCALGRLKYRAQIRRYSYLDSVDSFQPVAQINYPGGEKFVRIIEWKKLMQNPPQGTLLSYETPYTPDSEDVYEYPFPDRKNNDLYHAYFKMQSKHVTICGRLGEYRYYDMDMAIARAMKIAAKFI